MLYTSRALLILTKISKETFVNICFWGVFPRLLSGWILGEFGEFESTKEKRQGSHISLIKESTIVDAATLIAESSIAVSQH